ncbi:MAG: dienelactone hydrolase family protein [Legionella sp.]
MHTSNYIYHHGEQELHGFLAYDDCIDEPRPAVLIAHDWGGRSELFCDKARLLAQMGYVAFALDVYGHARLGASTGEKQALMMPLINDRALLSERLRAGLDTVIALSEVDASKIAAIGLCFGGLCVLDLARSGADVKGVVSFHGLLNKPEQPASQPIVAKVLALHGYEDPMVSPEQVNEFCLEMTAAQVDWQVHTYGHAKHAFANPHAHDDALGTVYNEAAAKRSWLAMSNFLQELFD